MPRSKPPTKRQARQHKKKQRPRKPNKGSFCKGDDPRRHRFTPEEARAAYQAGWDKFAAISPEALAWYCRLVRNRYRKEKSNGPTQEGRRAG